MALTSSENLQALLALQQIDTQIQRAKKSQANLDNGAAALVASQAAQSASQAATNALHKASGELKDAELKLAAIETKHKSYTQKLYQGTVTSAKELGNIEKEIALLGRQQSDMDTKILEAMDAQEAAQAAATVAEAQAREAETRHHDTVAQFQARHEALTLEVTDASRRRAAAAAAVDDKALLKQYDDIRARHAGIGIAKIIDGDCGACHMKLPSALVKLVREGAKPELCENCGRLLTV